MLHRLEDRIAIVTGAESGIGAATALALAAEGCAVAINYHTDRETAEAVRAGALRLGVRAIIIEADVADEASVAAMFTACENELGSCNILVSNAGVNAKTVSVADMPVEEWDKTIATNLRGAFLCARAFVRARRGKSGPGRIVMVSSIHEDVAVPGWSDYDASKAGLLAFTKTLALEVAPLGITANAVAPGMILTAMNAEAQADPNVLEEKTAHVPLHRAGTAEEIAAAIVFLCTEAAGYITGTSLRIDGGLSLMAGQGA